MVWIFTPKDEHRHCSESRDSAKLVISEIIKDTKLYYDIERGCTLSNALHHSPLAYYLHSAVKMSANNAKPCVKREDTYWVNEIENKNGK